MQLATIELVRRQSDDGLAEAKDSITIGKRYLVDLDTLRIARFWHTEKHVEHTKTIVNTVDEVTRRRGGYLFFDLLKLVES